jgi:hydroxymethylpyrimidine/phosphomethylpyrimidine kinase
MSPYQKNYRPIVLSVAGFDPSAGAGVLADIKSFEALKTYGIAVNTGITIQNDIAFEHINWANDKQIKSSINILAKRYVIEVAKIGLHKNIQSVQNSVNLILKAWPKAKIIWDPILKSSSGFDFQIKFKKNQLIELLKKIFLITPNTEEFKKIGISESEYPCHLLIKGGHSQGKYSEDILFLKGKKIKIFKSLRKKGIEKHGSGCVLSAAISAYIAKGNSMNQSISLGKKYINRFLSSNKTLCGYHVN